MNKSIIYKAKEDKDIQEDLRKLEALQKELKALQQESCEDVVSRQSVIDCFKKWQPYMATRLHEFENELFELPSVNPQKPKASYISIDDVMSVFDDFMCGEVDEDGTETFLEMLKDKAESEDNK